MIPFQFPGSEEMYTPTCLEPGYSCLRRRWRSFGDTLHSRDRITPMLQSGPVVASLHHLVHLAILHIRMDRQTHFAGGNSPGMIDGAIVSELTLPSAGWSG